MTFGFKNKLYDYQQQAANWQINKKNAIFALDTSCGKSLCSIASAFGLKSLNKIDKAITVVTATAKISLQEEYEKHTNVIPFIIEEPEDLNKDFDFALIQYERIESFDTNLLVNFFNNNRVLTSIDEIHKLKNTNANITQKFYTLRPYLDYVGGYTATPITSSVDDLFNLANFVKPGILNTYDSFLQNYVNYKEYRIPIKKGSLRKRTVRDIYGYKNIDILKCILSEIQFVYFPHKNINFIPIYYDCDSVLDKYIDAVSGTLEEYKDRKIDKEGIKQKKSHSARMLDAQYVLDSAKETQNEFMKLIYNVYDRGVLVYGNYHKTLDIIKHNLDRANILYKSIDGKVSIKDRKDNKDWFSDDPRYKVICLSKAGAQSLNLQATNNLIIYNSPFTIGEMQQLIGRVARLNSKYKEFNIYFLLPQIKGKPTLNCYKYNYAAANKNIVCNLFDNDNMYDSALLEFNSNILRNMRRETLWNFQYAK